MLAVGGALHLQCLAEDEEVLPAPSSLDEIMSDAAYMGGVVMFVSNRAIRVDITLPADVLVRIGAQVEEHRSNRSSFLLQAAEHAMGMA